MKLAVPIAAILAVGALAFAVGTAADAAVIIWVTENTDGSNPPSPDDVGWTDLLSAQGHTVSRRNMTSLDAGKIADMEAADLVMVSRDTNSGNYTQGSEVSDWNGISTPLMLMSQYLTRNSRWKWVNTGGTPNNSDGDLQVIETGHPIFQGVALGPGDTLDFASSQTPVTAASIGNGTLLATDDDNSNIAIALWDPGSEFYSGSGQTAGDYRVFFGAGVNGNNPKGAFNLTPDGEQVFLNAVDFLLPGQAIIPEPSTLLIWCGLASLGIGGWRRRRSDCRCE